MYKAVLLLALFAVAAHAAGLVGAPADADVNDPTIKTHLQKVMEQQNSRDTLTKVTKATKQVVSGIKWNVDFETTDNKQCNAVYVVQEWISPVPQVLSYSCKIRGIELEFGGEAPEVDDFTEKMGVAAVDSYNMRSNCISVNKLANILSIKTKMIPPSAMKVTLNFMMGETNCVKNRKTNGNCDFLNDKMEKCVASIMSEPWRQNIKVTSVTCTKN